MNSKAIISAIVAMSLSTSGVAFAQRGVSSVDADGTVHFDGTPRAGQPARTDNQVRQPQARQPQARQPQVRQPQVREPQVRQPQVRQPVRRDYQGRSDNYARQDARSYRQFRRGDRLPSEYRSRQYVVDDWRGHHLNRPPRGYHWVQSGNDYFLVAITTGIILQLLMNN